MVQESRVHAHSWLRTEVRRCGWKYISGEICSDERDLVAIIIKSGGVTELQGYRSARTCAAVWFPGCSACVRLYCVYGGADGTQGTYDLTSRWVREALIDAESSGMLPALIAGDLNLEAHQLECAPALALATSSHHRSTSGAK